MGGGHRAFYPGIRSTKATIIDKAQALPFEILKLKTEAAIAFGDQNTRLASPLTRNPVDVTEDVPRTSRPTGHSKNVRSVPGVPSASA